MLCTFTNSVSFIYQIAEQLRRSGPSEHLTPKDVVITSAPGQAELAMFLKGQWPHT